MKAMDSKLTRDGLRREVTSWAAPMAWVTLLLTNLVFPDLPRRVAEVLLNQPGSARVSRLTEKCQHHPAGYS